MDQQKQPYAGGSVQHQQHMLPQPWTTHAILGAFVGMGMLQ